MKLNPDSFIFEFHELFSEEYYLHFTGAVLTDEITEKQVGFVIEKMGLESGQAIADFGCGHGRHANRLAQRGFKVTGIDITPHFLEIARKDAFEMGVEVNYIQEDLRDIDLVSRFHAGVMLFTTFGYFDDQTNLRILKNIRNALRRGGKFCIDVINRDYLMNKYLPSSTSRQGDDLLVDIHNFDALTGRLIVDRKYIIDNQVHKASFSIRLYSFTELALILEKSGFRVLDVYGSFDGDTLTMSSKRLIVIAQKAAIQSF